MTTPFKIVRIEWIDAVATNEWKTIKDLEKEEHDDTEPCVTIGFLIRSNRQYYYVASTITNTGSEALVNSIMMIPKKWVKSKVELEVDP